MLDEIYYIVDNEPFEGASNLQIGNVLVDRVEFKNAKNALVALKQLL